jgi:maltooligosyltrehalose trehalohydrolase
VFLYAPSRLYGTPDDFKAFVDRAHQIGLGVILDVVYNHLGPSGCVHREFASQYFTDRYENEWGDALDFDGPGSAPVREHFARNAPYWVDEYHLDGLRVDAIQGINDASSEHLVTELSRLAREAAPHRGVLIVVENERQESFAMRSAADGGYTADAAWNDDFHHSAAVALTGRRQAYFSDHRGTPQEFISAAKYGYLFQGQRYAWQKQGRGTRGDDLPPAAFVNYLDNHDQIANAGDGSRIHAYSAPGMYRAMKALLLLMPGTPMLFQGEEFGATSPFLYFADHEGDLADAVYRGRSEFLRQFPSLSSPDAQALIPVPHDVATFERCKLDWTQRDRHSSHVDLHTDLLALRRSDAAFRAQQRGVVDGAVLGREAFLLRYNLPDPADDRLLVINFGVDLVADSFPEPLIAPPTGCLWQVQWSSEHVRYGGIGVPVVVTADGWRVPGCSATVLAPAQKLDDSHRHH